MESDLRYYERRASAEERAVRRALTPEARARRQLLVDSFHRRIAELRALAV